MIDYKGRTFVKLFCVDDEGDFSPVPFQAAPNPAWNDEPAGKKIKNHDFLLFKTVC